MICPSCGKERNYFNGEICMACDHEMKSERGVESKVFIQERKGTDIPFRGYHRFSNNTKKPRFVSTSK
jgi:hypothetical protein